MNARMRQIFRCTAIATLVFVSGGCREKVDLVRNWRLEGAREVMLLRELTKKTLTLSDPAEVKRFLRYFRKGVRGEEFELMVIGKGEFRFLGRPPCRFSILIRDTSHPKPRLAVKRHTEGASKDYYYLPKGFVRFWKEHIGLPADDPEPWAL